MLRGRPRGPGAEPRLVLHPEPRPRPLPVVREPPGGRGRQLRHDAAVYARHRPGLRPGQLYRRLFTRFT